MCAVVQGNERIVVAGHHNPDTVAAVVDNHFAELRCDVEYYVFFVLPLALASGVTSSVSWVDGYNEVGFFLFCICGRPRLHTNGEDQKKHYDSQKMHIRCKFTTFFAYNLIPKVEKIGKIDKRLSF